MPDRQTGFCFRYGVEKTPDKGLGVFAREAIGKGSVVWRHLPGIFDVYDEERFMAWIGTMTPAEAVYELTHVHGMEDFPGCLIRALDDGILINHAGDPTLVTNNAGPAGVLPDPTSGRYLREVAQALLDDRYALVATRDIEPGEELTNDYATEDACPAYYDALCERFGIREDYLNDR